MSINNLLLLGAMICFAIAFLGIQTRLNITALGLLLFAASFWA